MASEKQQLIDVLKLYHDNRFTPQVYEHSIFGKAALLLERSEEVVLCKDCKHRGDDVHCPMCFEETIEIDEGNGYWDTDYITHDRTIDDGYCDRGERKDNE